MSPFFVTGLPRSRTAWCANWLTTDRSFCFHDRAFGNFQGPIANFYQNEFLGWSGSEILFQWKEISDACPAAPWLLIERDPEEARRSFLAAMERNGDCVDEKVFADHWALRLGRIEELKKYGNVFRVPADLLDDVVTARTIWQCLLPGLPFNPERWLLLRGLNVQQDVQKLRAKT